MPTALSPAERSSVSCNHNVVKVLISLAQLIYAISTLYRTRGDQVTQYGYAAFGLTVAPYAWMTFINLLGNLMCPQYDAMFLVESKSLDQLRAQIGTAAAARRVKGTVGRLTDESYTEYLESRYPRIHHKFRFSPMMTAIVGAVLPNYIPAANGVVEVHFHMRDPINNKE